MNKPQQTPSCHGWHGEIGHPLSRVLRLVLIAALGALTVVACAPQLSSTRSTAARIPSSLATPSSIPTATAIPISIPRYTFRIVNTYPHDPKAYTQGLVYEDGFLYEGTGLRGESTLRKVDLPTGEVVQSLALDPEIFGEGIALLDERIIQLTLTSGVGFVYERENFSKLDEFSYIPEGWGLTHDGKQLIMSDGSTDLRFLDPGSFEEISRITVVDNDVPIQWLNELEYVEGEIYANVWQSDQIARISPETGKVLGWIDLSGIRGDKPRAGILNGIAYDPESQHLFVTGKNWPELFEIELIAE